jgi:hypothetical protein
VARELWPRSSWIAGLQKMGGECVSKCVRVEMVEVRSAANRVVELPADGPVAEAPPALIDEEWVVLIIDASAPAGAFGKIGFDGSSRRPAKRHEALLASLAAHPDHPLTELDITEVESHEFANAEPRGVKKLHRCAVTTPRGGVWKTFEELLDCVTVGDLRCSLDVVGVGHGICRARLEGTLGDQEAEIGSERGECARNGARLETARVEVSEVGPHGHGSRLRGPTEIELRGDEIDKGEDFAAVGAEGRG